MRLARRGTLSVLELDTNHFKGNFPDRAAVFGVDAPGARLTDLVRPDAPFVAALAPVSLRAHERHFFGEDALAARGPFTHLRVDVYPDGGISRLRAWGHVTESAG